jgi:thymidine phosphorylase
MSDNKKHTLKIKKLGIATYKEAIVYLRQDSCICKSEGFEAQSRIKVSLGKRSIIATMQMITDGLLSGAELGLSDYAFELLGGKNGDLVSISHPNPLNSMNHVRAKIFNRKLSQKSFQEIIDDVACGNLSDMQVASFITACAGKRLDFEEIKYLTQAMVNVGSHLDWGGEPMVVDKHCLGGIPGNRTTIIVVPIVAEFGLTIPKTSSRAITSAAGTADAMETLAPVALDLRAMRRVVEKENGCIVWADAASLSPADDILIRAERVLNLDSHGQMVASVFSKKIAAGSTHVVLDIPIGPTAKVRTKEDQEFITSAFQYLGKALDIKLELFFSDGTRPVGYGIGPALEAYDVLAVLQNSKNAPADLRARSLALAGKIIEFSLSVKKGTGQKIAEEILVSGKAFKKFQAICNAQGGLLTPPRAPYTYAYEAKTAKLIEKIDNRRIAKVAKLAGAPHAKAAGIYLHANVGSKVKKGEPILTVHAESKGELDYAVNYLISGLDPLM